MGSSGQGALPQLSNAPPFGESPSWGIFSLLGCLCSSEDHAMTSQQGKFQAPKCAVNYKPEQPRSVRVPLGLHMLF